MPVHSLCQLCPCRISFSPLDFSFSLYVIPVTRSLFVFIASLPSHVLRFLSYLQQRDPVSRSLITVSRSLITVSRSLITVFTVCHFLRWISRFISYVLAITSLLFTFTVSRFFVSIPVFLRIYLARRGGSHVPILCYSSHPIFFRKRFQVGYSYVFLTAHNLYNNRSNLILLL